METKFPSLITFKEIGVFCLSLLENLFKIFKTVCEYIIYTVINKETLTGVGITSTTAVVGASVGGGIRGGIQGAAVGAAGGPSGAITGAIVGGAKGAINTGSEAFKIAAKGAQIVLTLFKKIFLIVIDFFMKIGTKFLSVLIYAAKIVNNVLKLILNKLGIIKIIKWLFVIIVNICFMWGFKKEINESVIRTINDE
ncbi:hypothetical protein CWO85_00995 [Candidatus Phytoplasma ziziphi]|uniref:Uncharacterized protein n=1 Tax=Ziziphus jujuba witches'-broom phytoplasma TaxID=135727 RepID=A0A660HM49_ZIZJU|nr:hypothetical protein [Candidatus Phytoplasma ziziphi]AYJ01113.1 hypothetical protein CWO85_00995 [Candidatus Phytoplasma ziziphi]